MANYKPYIDVIFRDAETLMAELSRASGEFTNQQFLKEAARRSPGAYIDLLVAVRDHRGAAEAFNVAHENMGGRLADEAHKAGYEKIVESGKTETDIFGHPTRRVIYRRLE